jgi:hypothetical protein
VVVTPTTQQNLEAFRYRPLLSAVLLLLLGLLLIAASGCNAESPPRLGDAGPRPADPPPSARTADPGGAALTATGRQSFRGPTAFGCVLHDEEGLQVNFRTGDPEIPAVVVRIGEYRGSGPYHGELLVTGRSRSGGLVGSAGDATLEVRQRELPDEGTVVLLSGRFQGSYTGEAGKGSIQGRFGPCSYTPSGEPSLLTADGAPQEDLSTGP